MSNESNESFYDSVMKQYNGTSRKGRGPMSDEAKQKMRATKQAKQQAKPKQEETPTPQSSWIDAVGHASNGQPYFKANGKVYVYPKSDVGKVDPTAWEESSSPGEYYWKNAQHHRGEK